MTDLEPIERKLYDAEPEWSEQRREAFVIYRDMGNDRSLRAVAQALQKDQSLVARWSMQNNWRMRVAAWDAEQDRVRQAAAKAELERVTRKHARAIEDTIEVLMQPAVQLAQRLRNGDEKLFEEMSAVELGNLTALAGKQLPALVTASRLVHGVSTANIEAKSETRIAIEGATPADLDAMLLDVEDGTEGIIEGTAHERET